MKVVTGSWIVALVTCISCGTWEGAPPDEEPTSKPPAPVSAPAPQQVAPGTAQPEPEAATVPPTAQGDQEQKVSKAAVGVGRKGRRYGGGIVTEPVRTRFRAQERIVFDNVTYALKLYQAEHGQLPKSHDEFMEKIIRFNQISLPSLPTGDEYWYDADKGQLMVRHPD